MGLGERWVRFGGRIAPGPAPPVILLVFGLMLCAAYFINQSFDIAMLGVVWMVVALMLFERRQFWRIIQRQERQLDDLKRSGG